MSSTQEKREAEYKRDWINKHNQADEMIANQSNKEGR